MIDIGVLDLHCPKCNIKILADAILESVICDKCGFEFPILEGL